MGKRRGGRSQSGTTAKALNARKNVKKGQHQKRKHRVYKRPRFFLPRTLALQRKPKFPRHHKQLADPAGFNKYSIIIQPKFSEKATQRMEVENTLTFQVALYSTKKQIRAAFDAIYNPGKNQDQLQYQIKKINTLIT